MTLYPEMNNKIVELLRMGDTPVELYAAQRIEELELKNMELIDRVLEIIDDRISLINKTVPGHNLEQELEIIRPKILALKGGEQV